MLLYVAGKVINEDIMYAIMRQATTGQVVIIIQTNINNDRYLLHCLGIIISIDSYLFISN